MLRAELKYAAHSLVHAVLLNDRSHVLFRGAANGAPHMTQEMVTTVPQNIRNVGILRNAHLEHFAVRSQIYDSLLMQQEIDCVTTIS